MKEGASLGIKKVSDGREQEHVHFMHFIQELGFCFVFNGP